MMKRGGGATCTRREKENPKTSVFAFQEIRIKLTLLITLRRHKGKGRRRILYERASRAIKQVQPDCEPGKNNPLVFIGVEKMDLEPGGRPEQKLTMISWGRN